MGTFGGLCQLAGGLGQQSFVGRHDRLTLLQCRQDGFAGRFDRAHQLDDDVDVVARDQFLDVVGEQSGRHAAIVGDPADGDTAQFQRRPMRAARSTALSSMMRTTSLPTLPRPRTATPIGFSLPIVLPHFQTQQVVDGLPAQDQAGPPLAHGHHRRRPIRLYRLDIE